MRSGRADRRRLSHLRAGWPGWRADRAAL